MKFELDKTVCKNKLKASKNVDSVKFHKYLVELLEIKSSDKILDLGCGHGQTVVHIAEKIGKNGKAYGLDVNENLLAVAERVLANHIKNGKVELLKENVSNRLPFSNNYLDKIVCHNVLECIPDKAKLINECHRVLKNGGLLIMSHSDFDTQVFNSSNPDITRKLVHNFSDTKQEWMEASDGTTGRKMAGIFRKSKFNKIEVFLYVMTNTEFKPLNYGFDMAQSISAIGLKSGKFKKAETEKWINDLRLLHKMKEYFYSININIVVAKK